MTAAVTPPEQPGTIEARPFKPTEVALGRPAPFITRRRLVVLAVVTSAAWFMWFIFTAKSVRFEVSPEAETLDIYGGFAFRLGEVHLLREGSYRVRAKTSGHHDLEREIEVRGERNQVIALAMTKLPGRLTFDVDPVGATIEIAGHDDLVGEAPFHATVPAGAQTAFVSHPRYQAETVEFTVAGMDQSQTVSVALAPNWADLTLPTKPSGADVLIDNELSGFVTPGPVPILAGERRVTAKLPGYKSWTDILHIEAGRDVLLPSVALEKADGLVTVYTMPRGAGVTIDGAYRGTTPLELALMPGRHQVSARKVGYSVETATVEIGSGEERRLSFTLTALQGDLAVQTSPPTAELWIDGKHSGTAAGVHTLPAVPHEIEIRKDGYASYRKTVTPQPGFTQELKVRLLTLAEARMEALKRIRTTGAGHELVLLRPSAIRMGASRREPGRRANEVLRTANLTRLFYLGRQEVTNAQFRAFASGHSSGEFQNIDLDQDDQPAVGVSWTEAAQYCNWLSRKDDLEPFYEEEFGQIVGFDASALGYRLPTEAEWAWTARHVDDETPPRRFAWGQKLPPPERHGNYADVSASHSVARTIFGYDDNNIVSAPVGTFPANSKDVYDLGGNVAEWVHDFYEIPDGTDSLNPLGPSEGEYHVIRGASWRKGTVTDLRLSFRDYGSDGRQDVGFRIARFAE